VGEPPVREGISWRIHLAPGKGEQGARADGRREAEHDAWVWMPTMRAYRVVEIKNLM
jgi:hypothetical protein